MTIRIDQIIKPYLLMTADEKLDLVRKIRHRKYVEKPAVKKRVQKKAKKQAKKASRSVNSLVSKLTDAQKAALLKELEDA